MRERWEADERPEPRSLGLLPSGPDPVGEWLVNRRVAEHRLRSHSMSPRPDLGPKPRLGYAASSIERASERRADAAALAALENDRDARAYLLAGELVILKKTAGIPDPLFTLAEARALGRTAEIVFLGLCL